ncbi:MAG: sigma-70 family RNA polymerase sigma factor [bacterium]|nr:sigma-70 family RNA polymerase sigma factor [bacterium]
MTANKDTEILLSLARNGNIHALETLIRSEQRQIYAIFSHLTNIKEDISDLTQEVLLKMTKNLYQLKDLSSFRIWLNKIVANTYKDYIKKKKGKFAEISEEEINEIKDKPDCEPGEKCIFGEIEKLIQNALFTLPHTLRLTLVLREYEGLSYQDISKITHTSLGTVKSRISRARFRLQKVLKEYI